MTCPHCPCPDRCARFPIFCEWAAKRPPVPTEIRHICERSASATYDPPTVPIALTKQALRLGFRNCLYSAKPPGCGCLHCHHLGRKITLHACIECLGLDISE